MDLNPSDRGITASRGESLVPRLKGHLPIGFNDAAYLVGQLDLDKTTRIHRRAGSTIWRLPLDWGQVEHTPGEFNFARYDEVYCSATAAGLRPLWHITGVPSWTVAEGECVPSAPCVRPPGARHLPALRRFAEAAAVRYPGSAAFEAWNEPNLVEFWGEPPAPATYLPVLEAIYTGIKDGNPEMPVLGGALSNNSTDHPGGSLSLQTYLGAMVEGGALRHMDGLSLHAYPSGAIGAEGDAFTDALSVARRSLGAESPSARLWVTEIGVPTQPGAFLPPVSEPQQAELMAEAYRALDRSGDVDAVIFHTLVDPPASVPGGPGFGFFTAPASGPVSPKPVVCAVLREASPSPDCPQTTAEQPASSGV